MVKFKFYINRNTAHTLSVFLLSSHTSEGVLFDCNVIRPNWYIIYIFIRFTLNFGDFFLNASFCHISLSLLFFRYFNLNVFPQICDGSAFCFVGRDQPASVGPLG